VVLVGTGVSVGAVVGGRVGVAVGGVVAVAEGAGSVALGV